MFRLILVVCLCAHTWAARYELEGVQLVDKIRVEDVLHGLDLNSDKQINDAIKKLYSTGWFKRVDAKKADGKVRFKFVENPKISGYKISSDLSAVKKEVLSDSLESQGFKKFQVFNQSKLDSWVREVKSQLAMQGHTADIKIDLSTTENGQSVFIDIDITEQEPLLVKTIDITGAPVFKQDHLLKVMDVYPTTWLSWLKKDNIYSQRKIEVAKAKLLMEFRRSGYFDVAIKTKVITLNSRQVALQLAIDPGALYQVKSVSMSGVPAEIASSFKELEGHSYNYSTIEELIKKSSEKHVENGKSLQIYAEIKEVRGNNVYLTVQGFKKALPKIRRLIFKDQRTDEMALRKMVLFHEGGLFNPSAADKSKQRLMNTSFIKQARILTEPVSGKDGEVDVVVYIEENARHTQASLSLNYSTGGYGASISAAVDNKNWLDTGNTLTLSTSMGKVEQSINLYLSQPANFYESSSTMGLGFNKKNTKSLKSARFKLDQANIFYGHTWLTSKMGELSSQLMLKTMDLTALDSSPDYVHQFVQQHGRSLQELLLTTRWSYSTLNRFIHPTDGFKLDLTGKIGLPLIDKFVEYGVVEMDLSHYTHLFDAYEQPVVFKSRLSIGWGQGYGTYSGDLPFFQRFHAGGFGTVRGYSYGSLGSKISNQSIGGNILLTGGLEVLLPSPKPEFITPSLFFDAGNVYTSDISLKDLRYSAGMSAEIWVPMGTIVVSAAHLFNRDSNKKSSNRIQVDIGQSF